METCSPSKRRALAPLNANALASPKTLFKDAKPLGANAGSPVKLSAEGRKRMFEVDAAASPIGKKACLGRDEDASSRSHSPDASSLFDTSANDASWTTAATEPEAAAPLAAAALEQMPVTRPRALTREQAREKVEILRLRLSLANYKVRTGQTTVPLADLQQRPLPRPIPRVRVQSPDDEDNDETRPSSPEDQEQTDSQATEEEPQCPHSDNADTISEASQPDDVTPPSPPGGGPGPEVSGATITEDIVPQSPSENGSSS